MIIEADLFFFLYISLPREISKLSTSDLFNCNKMLTQAHNYCQKSICYSFGVPIKMSFSQRPTRVKGIKRQHKHAGQIVLCCPNFVPGFGMKLLLIGQNLSSVLCSHVKVQWPLYLSSIIIKTSHRTLAS